MNYKTCALVSMLFLSFVLAGINANIKGTTYAQNNVISLKPLHKVEAGQEGISGHSKPVSGSIGENNVGSIRFIATTSASNGNNTINVSSGSKTFPVLYQITGNGNNLKNISVEKDNTTLITNIASQSGGKLTIQLPRSLIDSKKQGNQDSPYVIFEDSQPWQRVQQVKSNAEARTLSIDFDKGTGVMEIAGSKVLPEFGTVSAVVFAIAIIGIIMASTKYKHFKFLPNP
ncbi:MAG TPA: PEFG-CTERM sorting domain-containing protein [Nitrososphaeraceae archaeon]|nr:PEFG-CTERM sorting domain-containing protein [Nitrososphaeraceae archaeon]